MPPPSTPEAAVVRFADRIAYVNHDVDDAIRAGVLDPADLPKQAIKTLGHDHSSRVNTLVNDLVDASAAGIEIRLSEPVFAAMDTIRDFMFENVYLRGDAQMEQAKAISLVRALFAYYLDHPNDVPEEYHHAPGDLPTRVADYIAGMTDRYALRVYEQLFLPQTWLL
jgi:dGTPase